MPYDVSLPMPYIAALDHLTRALSTLDALNDGVAAAQLSGVIDLVMARIGDQSRLTH